MRFYHGSPEKERILVPEALAQLLRLAAFELSPSSQAGPPRRGTTIDYQNYGFCRFPINSLYGALEAEPTKMMVLVVHGSVGAKYTAPGPQKYVKQEYVKQYSLFGY